jgi:hypothetical protein
LAGSPRAALRRVLQPKLSDMLGGRREWSKGAIRSLSKLMRIPAKRFLG